MLATPEQVRADFDRLATVDEGGWDHNAHYHPFLLRHVPARCDAALDVGCGTGAFTRLLAGRAARVVGIDLSAEMVRRARDRSAGIPNVEYHVADLMAWDAAPESFDCVATLATLHHLPPAPAIERLARLLRPGGTLLVLDLYRAATAMDILVSALALPVSAALRLRRRARASPEAREAWAAHGGTDVYPTLAEVRRASAVLPGARVRRHLLWRYSLIWTKPGASGSPI